MTLADLIDEQRGRLADETVGMRRSWEEMFTYTLRHYSPTLPIAAFDPGELAKRLIEAGLHAPIVEAYVKRWQALLARAGEG